MSENKIEYIELESNELKPNKKNPRTINKNELKKLVESITGFKEMLKVRRILVDENNKILGGNMRYQACKKAGIKTIPVMRVHGWSEKQKEEFIIKDNISSGEWDWDALANEWDSSKLLDWGLSIDTTWDDSEKEELEDDNFKIPDEVQTKIKEGDIITIGEHRLFCGDATKDESYNKLFEDKESDLLITDPPYNVNYEGKTKEKLKIQNDKLDDNSFFQFLSDFFKSAYKKQKPGASYYIWHADSEGANFRQSMAQSGVKVRQCLIWVKNSMVMGRQDYHWKHEPCLYGWKDGASHNWYTDRKQTTVLEFDRPNRNAEHPTMKPIPLIGYQIQNSSKPQDIIVDPFCGSGTTMIASQQLKRICYAMELDPIYCQVIIDRMISLVPGIEIKVNGEAY